MLNKEYTTDVSASYVSAGTHFSKSQSKDSWKPLDGVLTGPGDIRAEGAAE